MADMTDAMPTRTEGLEINVVDDGFVVYQPSHDRVHYLNHTAAFVLELCNGRNRESELAELMRRAYDLPTAPTEEIAACLQTLRKQELIR